MKIAVLSDIHSASEHFSDALDAARDEGFDRLVILGDLFTYGPDPVETMELVQEAVSRDQAILITGNHDLLYMDEQADEYSSASLPEWIRESVDWTRSRLAGVEPLTTLPWQREWRTGRVLFSHANPFAFGDWTYLRDDPSFLAASQALADRQLDWGVFGHVHRHRSSLQPGRSGVVTVGSIGQPRDKLEPFSQWAMMTMAPEVEVQQRRVSRDWKSTIERIQASSMSDATKLRLCQFFQ